MLFYAHIVYLLFMHITCSGIYSYIRNGGYILRGQPTMSTIQSANACLSLYIYYICYGTYVMIGGDIYNCNICIYYGQLEASDKSCTYCPLLYIDYQRLETTYHKTE